MGHVRPPILDGFDAYLDVPSSNDMISCPLYRNETQLEPDIGDNQARLTGMYTTAAVEFIQANKKDPFFL